MRTTLTNTVQTCLFCFYRKWSDKNSWRADTAKNESLQKRNDLRDIPRLLLEYRTSGSGNGNQILGGVQSETNAQPDGIRRHCTFWSVPRWKRTECRLRLEDIQFYRYRRLRTYSFYYVAGMSNSELIDQQTYLRDVKT